MPLGKSCFRSIKIIHSGKEVQPLDRICSLRKVTQQASSGSLKLRSSIRDLSNSWKVTQTHGQVMPSYVSCLAVPISVQIACIYRTFLTFMCFPPSYKKETSVDPPRATSQLPFCKSLSDAKKLPTNQSSHAHLFTVNSIASWVPYLCFNQTQIPISPYPPKFQKAKLEFVVCQAICWITKNEPWCGLCYISAPQTLASLLSTFFLGKSFMHL